MWFSALIMFFKKNWKIILIVVGILYFMGMFKGLAGRFKMWANIGQMSSGGGVDHTEQFEPDYSLMCVNLYEALQGKKVLWIKWSEDENAAIAIINSLQDQQQFLKLVYMYANKYGKDLRNDLRRFMTDKQYSKLKFK